MAEALMSASAAPSGDEEVGEEEVDTEDKVEL